MKVYFIGSHSTGKTTLARYVSKKFNLPLLTEVGRAILAERELSISSIRSDLEVVDNYQMSVFNRQISEERKLTEFVADRCFDNLAYAAQHSRILHAVMEDPKTKRYIESLKHPDSIIFFVRPSQNTMKDDGVRESVAWDEILAIDAMVKVMLEMWGLRYFPLASASLQERSRFVDGVMSLALNKQVAIVKNSHERKPSSKSERR